MAEQLYTIPVNDAFSTNCECPLCYMYKSLENSAIEYTLGPSYMEDDNREMTDKLGFCKNHSDILFKNKNKLGLALMLNTHINKTTKDLKELSTKKTQGNSGLFKKNSSLSPVGEYIKNLENTCFICSRIDNTFNRYIDTIFHLWKKNDDFKKAFTTCNGFCTYHYGLLYDYGNTKLNKEAYTDFIEKLNFVYFDNIERVNKDISWFIDKFDYRYKDEPWKNSKDALARGLIKTNHTTTE